MKKSITLILFLSFLTGFSQNYPNFSNKTLKDVLNNSEWIIYNKTEGFLNNDKTKDFALIIESKDSLLEHRTGYIPRRINARILLVLINNKVIIQNNTFIPRKDEGGMNFVMPELSIKNRKLKIHIEYLRANTSYFFEFKNCNMNLIEADSYHRHPVSGNYEIEHYDFKNKILSVESGNISESKELYKKIPFKLKEGLKKLSELTEMYEWEVLKNRYL